jgi:ribosomal protein S25|tara:strand:- start:408 stop:530 length:123 start_codon:yes stop_codon:yes gene_type:complete
MERRSLKYISKRSGIELSKINQVAKLLEEKGLLKPVTRVK